MVKDVIRDWRLEDSEDSEGGESVNNEPDLSPSEVGTELEDTLTTEIPEDYDPYDRDQVALGKATMDELGQHSARLYQALVNDGYLPRQSEAGKLRHVIRRMQGQDGRYTKWLAKIGKKQIEVDMEDAELMGEIRHGALSRKEWTVFFCGLGGFLRRDWRDVAKKRNRYEDPMPPSAPKGWWTRVNNANARRSMVGTGNREDVIERQVLKHLKKGLGVDGECNW